MSNDHVCDDGTIAYPWRCPDCGRAFERALISVGYRYPDPWLDLDKDEQERGSTFWDLDFCRIEWPHQTDHFVRGIMELPIAGMTDTFLLGMWVSLSKRNFDHFRSIWHEEDPEPWPAAGWINNESSIYPSDEKPTADLVLQKGNGRPLIEPHRGDGLLFRDWSQGMPIERVIAFTRRFMPHDCEPAP